MSFLRNKSARLAFYFLNGLGKLKHRCHVASGRKKRTQKIRFNVILHLYFLRHCISLETCIVKYKQYVSNIFIFKCGVMISFHLF